MRDESPGLTDRQRTRFASGRLSKSSRRMVIFAVENPPQSSGWITPSGVRTPILASVASFGHPGSNREIRVELVLGGENAKRHFVALKNDYDQRHIEGALGLGLLWHNPTDKNQCRIYVRRDGDFLNRKNWDELHGWLKEKLETFDRVFAERVRNL